MCAYTTGARTIRIKPVGRVFPCYLFVLPLRTSASYFCFVLPLCTSASHGTGVDSCRNARELIIDTSRNGKFHCLTAGLRRFGESKGATIARTAQRSTKTENSLGDRKEKKNARLTDTRATRRSFFLRRGAVLRKGLLLLGRTVERKKALLVSEKKTRGRDTHRLAPSSPRFSSRARLAAISPSRLPPQRKQRCVVASRERTNRSAPRFSRE